MTAHQPVATLAELDALDDDEVREGYLDGRAGEPEPGDNRSRAYWHGWRCGMTDAGRLEIDPAHRRLVADYVARGRLA
jgi:hypothetical protein